MLKKIFKVIGILTLVVIGIILLLLAFVWGSIEWNRYAKKKEAIRYQKEVCDTMKTVDRKFEFTIDGFNKKEIKQVHFYLQQDKLIIKDSIVKVDIKPENDYQTVLLPFEKFRTTDRIIVNVGNRYFVLSGLNYRAQYKYGMLGPVGSCECEMAGFETLNGEPAGSGWLIKKYGLLNYQLPPG